MHFTVKEINQILIHDTPELFLKRINGKHREIKSIIDWYKALDAYMTEYEKKLQRISSELDTCVLTDSPEIYYILHYEDMNFLTENGSSHLYPLWLEKMPLVNIFSLSPLESVMNGPPLVRKGGLAVSAEHAALCGLDVQRKGVYRLEPCKCVYTLIAVENNYESLHNRFENVLDYIRNNNLTIAGDPWALLLFINYSLLDTNDPDTAVYKEKTVYYAYYIPVK
jgi:hypothetical protein